MSRALDDMIVGLAKVLFRVRECYVFLAKDSRKYDCLLYAVVASSSFFGIEK